VRIAYVVSQFPKLSETFILREILEVGALGHEITILSLKRSAEPLAHEETRPLLERTLYPAPLHRMAAASLYYLLRRPIAVMRATGRIVLAHAGHPILLAKSLALVPIALAFARSLREGRVAHVHAHWATYPATVAWVVSRLEGLTYSVTGHAHDLFLANPMLERKIRDSAFFATISEFNRALLIQRYGPEVLEKIRLIRCGLPLEEFPFDGVAAADRSGPPLVVSVGRLVEYKGFHVLIRAFAHLKRRGRPARCLIVGEGPERPVLERLASRLGVDEEVTFAGGMRQDEVRAAIGGADLFVLACVKGRDGQQDGIPIVLMEAMALGVPVVSTRLSGIPELVIDNRTGILVAPGDEEHLADGMERLLTDEPLARRLRDEARRMVEKEFDGRRWAARLAAGIREAAGAGRGGA